MSELETIGRLMLYRNRILEKLLRELSKDFPNMEIVLEEFERLLEAIDDLDNETIHTIAKLKERSRQETETSEADKEDEKSAEKEKVNFDEWFVEVLNSLNGRDSLKNYVLALKQMGGVALTRKIRDALGFKRSAISEIESELEKRKIILSLDIGGRKVVYFNHPDFTALTARELLDKCSK